MMRDSGQGGMAGGNPSPKALTPQMKADYFLLPLPPGKGWGEGKAASARFTRRKQAHRIQALIIVIVTFDSYRR